MPSGHTCQSGHYIHPFTWYQNIKCNVNTLFACIVLPENKILTLCLFIVSTNTLKCNSVANCQDNIFEISRPTRPVFCSHFSYTHSFIRINIFAGLTSYLKTALTIAAMLIFLLMISNH